MAKANNDRIEATQPSRRDELNLQVMEVRWKESTKEVTAGTAEGAVSKENELCSQRWGRGGVEQSWY